MALTQRARPGSAVEEHSKALAMRGGEPDDVADRAERDLGQTVGRDDAQKIQWVLCRIERRGVSGGISADKDQEIDDRRCGSIVRFHSFKSRGPLRLIGI